MATYTLSDLVNALRESAGEEEGVDLGGDILDRNFEDLGYDSLALYNTVSKVERELGVSLSDEVVSFAETPRALLAEINEALRQPA